MKFDFISGMRSITSCGQRLNITAHFVSGMNKWETRLLRKSSIVQILSVHNKSLPAHK